MIQSAFDFGIWIYDFSFLFFFNDIQEGFAVSDLNNGYSFIKQKAAPM